MASVLVYVERDGSAPAVLSLRALASARRIGDTVGATVYSAAVVGPDDDSDAWISALSCAGSDKIALLSATDNARLAGTWADVGESLAAICEHLSPSVILLAHAGDGRTIAPRLAARLEAAFLPMARVEFGDDDSLLVSRSAVPGNDRERVDCDELLGPLVVTTLAADVSVAECDDGADVMFFELPSAEPDRAVQDASDNPRSRLERADIVVTAGAGVPSASMALVTELALVLGGEWAVTDAACRLGHGPRSRVVGYRGACVAPRLYIAVGASGSAGHLTAVADDSRVVALCDDDSAPIMAAAQYRWVGRCQDALPALIAAARRRAAESSGRRESDRTPERDEPLPA